MAKPSVERDPALLLDMILYARDAMSFVSDIDREAFLASELHQSAVIRCLEVIGEAARKVSAATHTTLPDVPWADIIGMRNRLIHGYDTIDPDNVWRTVTNDLGPLIRALLPLIPDEGSSDS
jgi:uncharacterized protein with HEPN domain